MNLPVRNIPAHVFIWIFANTGMHILSLSLTHTHALAHTHTHTRIGILCFVLTQGKGNDVVVIPLNVLCFMFFFLIIILLFYFNSKFKKNEKKPHAKWHHFGGFNGSSNRFVTEPWMDKNWKLEDWINKSES